MPRSRGAYLAMLGIVGFFAFTLVAYEVEVWLTSRSLPPRVQVDTSRRPEPPSFYSPEPRVAQLPPPLEGYQLTYAPATEEAPELLLRAFTALGRPEPVAVPLWVEHMSGSRRWYAAAWSCNSITWSAEVSWAAPVAPALEEQQLDQTRVSLEGLCEPR